MLHVRAWGDLGIGRVRTYRVGAVLPLAPGGGLGAPSDEVRAKQTHALPRLFLRVGRTRVNADEVEEEVRRIKLLRAIEAGPFEVPDGSIRAPKVHDLPFAQKAHEAKHAVNGGAGLVDCRNHRAPVLCEIPQRLDHVLGLERVEARRGLVEEHEAWVAHHLDPDVHALLLSPRDATDERVADLGVRALGEAELGDVLLGDGALLGWREGLRQAQLRLQQHRLSHGEHVKELAVLDHIRAQQAEGRLFAVHAVDFYLALQGVAFAFLRPSRKRI